MRQNPARKTVTRLLALMLLLSFVLIISVLVYRIAPDSPENLQFADVLDQDQDIAVFTTLDPVIYVAEPFEYEIRVVYRPDRVIPDFRKLIRDISFAPFEQRHKTRTRISDISNNGGINQFLLSYTIVGIDVIPGEPYRLDPITVDYSTSGSGPVASITVEPGQILIDQYYTGEPLDIALQSVKGMVMDNSAVTRALLIFCMVLFFSLSAGLCFTVLKKEEVDTGSFADRINKRFLQVKTGMEDGRKKVIEYEKLLLSLFKSYGRKTAMEFWQSGFRNEQSAWSKYGEAIRPPLEAAYAAPGPAEPDLRILESSFDDVYLEMVSRSSIDREAKAMSLQGTAMQRIRRDRFTFIGGLIAASIGVIFFYLILNPSIWLNRDIQVFNNWMRSLPARLLDEERQHELNNLDIEMLGHISDQHRVLENLQSDALRSSYLYNYGTLATNIYKAILMMPPQDEEEEAPDPPTFEFPLQLMANSARFNPDDEAIRRNLEIIIYLKESHEKEGSGGIQGELGPPTPGFSRDMNPLLF